MLNMIALTLQKFLVNNNNHTQRVAYIFYLCISFHSVTLFLYFIIFYPSSLYLQYIHHFTDILRMIFSYIFSLASQAGSIITLSYT